MGEVSRRMVESGHEVTVITSDALDFDLFWDPNKRRIRSEYGTYQGVKIQRFPVRHLPAPSLAYAGVRRLLSIFSSTAIVPTSAMMRLARYTPWLPDLWKWTQTTKEQYDLVAGMTITFEPILAAGLALARREKIPFLCYPLTHLGAGAKPGNDAISKFYTMRHQIDVVRSSDGVIAMTPTEKKFYVDNGSIAERITDLGAGVRPTEVLGGDGPRFLRELGIRHPLVLFIGYHSRDKGIYDTVEAVRQLWRRGQEAELALIGTITPDFRRIYDKLPSSEQSKIHLLGPVEEPVKKDALAAATILSLPSRTDSFGITYLEAWLYGLPVIAARAWGITDIVEDGLDGLIVPFGDVDALCDSIQDLLQHPDKARAIGQRGRDKVYEKFLWENKLAEIEAIYLQLAHT